MAQFARPDSDNSIGAWTDDASGTTNIYTAIDETSASDTDYVRSEDNPATSVCNFTLSDVSDPTSSSGHVVRYRYRRQDSGGGSPPTINVTVRLRQGVASIASNSHSGISTTWTDGSFTLSGAEADSITDYADLVLEFEADKASGARTSWAEFSWGEFEVPDAVTTHTASASPTVGGATSSSTTAFTAPVYTGSATTTTGAATSTSSGTFAPPTSTGSSSLTTGSVTTSSSSTFVAPIYTATAAAVTGGATASATASTTTEMRSTSQFMIPLVTNDPDLRVTSMGMFSLSDNDPDLRVTSAGIFALSDNDPDMRATSVMGSILEVPPVWRYVPVSDISTGSWTTGATDLWENLVLDDATYIDSSLNPTGGDAFEVSLRNFYWPETNYRLWIAMRISKVDSGGTQQEDGNQLDVLVEAINDSTTIWQWNLTDIKQDQGYLILEAPVSSPLATPITPTVFSLKATATSDGVGADRKARISYFNAFSYDEFTATPVCLWWPCNCNPVNPSGCNECSIGLTGIPTNAAVTLSGATGSACCTGLNTTHNVTLANPYAPDGSSDPAFPCWAGGTLVPAACSPSVNPRIETYVNLVTGLVKVIVWDGTAPFTANIWRSWTAQMIPTTTGWDCSIDHTDFVDDGISGGSGTCGGTPSLDGFTLS